MEVGKSIICKANVQLQFKGWQLLQNQKESVPQFEGYQLKEFSLTQSKISIFFYFNSQLIECGPLTLWMAICFSQSIDLSINLFQKHSHRNIQIMFGQIAGYAVAQLLSQILFRGGVNPKSEVQGGNLGMLKKQNKQEQQKKSRPIGIV